MESNIKEKCLFFPELNTISSQKYLDQMSAPVAPKPLPANTKLVTLLALYFLWKMCSRLDLMTLLPRKYKSFPLYFVAFVAQPWKREPSHDGIMTFIQFSQAGSSSIPPDMMSQAVQYAVISSETVTHLSNDPESELPPQNIGVGVVKKYARIPSGAAKAFDSTQTKLCAPLRHIALASSLCTYLLNVIPCTTTISTSTTTTDLDICMI